MRDGVAVVRIHINKYVTNPYNLGLLQKALKV